jgi:hypothetical protein
MSANKYTYNADRQVKDMPQTSAAQLVSSQLSVPDAHQLPAGTRAQTNLDQCVRTACKQVKRPMYGAMS